MAESPGILIDRVRAGNDFKPDPERDHTSEITILGLPAKKGMIRILKF
jgi:hypothetical protein